MLAWRQFVSPTLGCDETQPSRRPISASFFQDVFRARLLEAHPHGEWEAELRSLAFYLPQFHPIPENDAWWGEALPSGRPPLGRDRCCGVTINHTFRPIWDFTTSVFLKVERPRRRWQARYGIDGFCYYHYWFEGRRLLERPFDEVLRSGEPEFPFCLCWANESWTRRWDGGDHQVLLRQTYSAADDLEHIRWLAAAFADPRYVRVQGRPLFLVYRVSELPDPQRTADVWRRESTRLGAGDPYLCIVHNFDV